MKNWFGLALALAAIAIVGCLAPNVEAGCGGGCAQQVAVSGYYAQNVVVAQPVVVPVQQYAVVQQQVALPQTQYFVQPQAIQSYGTQQVVLQNRHHGAQQISVDSGGRSRSRVRVISRGGGGNVASVRVRN